MKELWSCLSASNIVSINQMNAKYGSKKWEQFNAEAIFEDDE